MKVVLFCGGLGLRIRDAEDIPKPMVHIGSRPILWHVMKYYAHFGHKDFILCLGYRPDAIKNYFLHYDECMSNDFVLSDGGKKLELISSDTGDWRITFVDTGIHSNIGQRLKAAQKHSRVKRSSLPITVMGLQTFPYLSNSITFTSRGRSRVFFAFAQISAITWFRLNRETEASFQIFIRLMTERTYQWRFLHLQETDLRLHEGQRGTRDRAVSSPVGREAVDRVSI